MDETTLVDTQHGDAASAAAEAGAQTNTILVEALVVEELLVEEISIDGMCGVY